mgnify:FL=1
MLIYLKDNQAELDTYHTPSKNREYIYMLKTILKSELAAEQSKNMIRLFKGMKGYIMENKDLVTKSDILQMPSQINQNQSEKNLIKYHLVTSDEDKHKEILILDGQKREAEEAYMRIYKQAKKTIDIIDNLSSSLLTKKDLEIFSWEYDLKISLSRSNDKFDDRYTFIDLGFINEKIKDNSNRRLN